MVRTKYKDNIGWTNRNRCKIKWDIRTRQNIQTQRSFIKNTDAVFWDHTYVFVCILSVLRTTHLNFHNIFSWESSDILSNSPPFRIFELLTVASVACELITFLQTVINVCRLTFCFKLEVPRPSVFRAIKLQIII